MPPDGNMPMYVHVVNFQDQVIKLLGWRVSIQLQHWKGGEGTGRAVRGGGKEEGGRGGGIYIYPIFTLS